MKVYGVIYANIIDSGEEVCQKCSLCGVYMTRKAAWKDIEERFNNLMDILCFGVRKNDFEIISIKVDCDLHNDSGLRNGVKMIYTHGSRMCINKFYIKQFELQK